MIAATEPGLWTTAGNWALVFSIVGNIALVIGLWRQKQSIEQPFEVRVEKEFAREKDCRDRHELSLRQLAELRGARDKDAETASLSRKALYLAIKDSDDKTKACVDTVRRELSDKIENMPDRVVAMLRNFGVIGENHK